MEPPPLGLIARLRRHLEGLYNYSDLTLSDVLTGMTGPQTRRMSSSNGRQSHRNSSSQSGAQTDSRKSSSVNLNSSLVRTHDGDGHLGPQAASSNALVAETGPVDMVEAQKTGSRFLSDPFEGRQWLIDFGSFKDDTHVSMRLRTISSVEKSDPPHSIFPVLATWVPHWFKSAQEKRKAEKSSRAITQHEFDWLLQYTADYVDIGHDYFDPEEMQAVCAAIIDICQRTTRATDIDVSISIIYRISLHAAFPKELLSQALDVLCAAAIILSEPPTILSSCVELFLQGPMQANTLDQLFEFVVMPTVQNNSEKLTQGRGAVRQLSTHIDLTDEPGNLIINSTRLIDAFHQASKSCIYRYCTEVLRSLHAMFDSVHIERIILADFDQILDTAENCVRTVLPRSTSSRASLPPQSPDREEVMEQEKHAHRYLADRNEATKKLLANFEAHWNILDNLQRDKLANLFMDHGRELTNTQASLVINDLKIPAVTRCNVTDLSAHIGRVFDAFMRNQKLDVALRVLVVEYCGTVAGVITDQGHEVFAETRSQILTVGNNIVDRLLNAMANEHDGKVLRALVSALSILVIAENHEKQFPHADTIIRRFQWLAKNDRDSGEELEDEHGYLATCAIRKTFLNGLHRGATLALKAFDALIDIIETTKARRSQLVAMRVLIRLRCDNRGFLYMQNEADSEYIAVALCRTDEAREAFAADHAVQRLSATNLTAVHHSAPKQLWTYPTESTHANYMSSKISALVCIRSSTKQNDMSKTELRISDWLITVIKLFQGDTDWEILSFLLVHLGAQLFNTRLFETSLETIVKLRQILCDQVINGTFREPLVSTGLKKSDSALCMFNLLTALIPYATFKSEHIQKGFGDDLVKAFLSGIGGPWDGTSRGCIHALCVCSFEIPASVASQYPNIITKMSKNMTQSHLTNHILEFLAQVARLPEVHSNFTQDDITMIFGICLQFLEKTREHQMLSLNTLAPRSATPARHSGLNLRRPPYRAAMLQDLGLPQYASALAYHTMIFWFLSLKLEFRAKYVSWIVPRLVWKTAAGEETVDEQSQVFIDFMLRTAFSDLGETRPIREWPTAHEGPISSCSWIVGLSIITLETAGQSGLTKVTKRQAAGTTHAIYQQATAPLPSHHVAINTEIRSVDNNQDSASMLPPHVLLQMMTTAAPTTIEEQPLPLPREEFVTRALNVFDRIPTVDSHKLGVLYIGRQQAHEHDYLANISPSLHYQQFLDGLGYMVSLYGDLEFNPQGLQYPRDGEHTLAWRDRITEIVYHVPTMMPNNPIEDPACNMKKSHVGNCHAVIVFNESGLPWVMEKFPSAVTFVHIVITPANRSDDMYETDSASPKTRIPDSEHVCDYYSVHVLTKENHSNVTPAADPKVISREMLPGFVRMLGLSANVFSQAKVADDSGDHEFPSSWRTRLQQIKTLKQRVIDRSGSQQHGTSGTPAPTIPTPAAAGRRTPVVRDDHQNLTKDSDQDAILASQLDFGKWTL